MSRIDKKNQKVSFRHNCELGELADEILPTPPPFAPFWHKISHYLRRAITVQENYESRQYFRSKAAFDKEKTRHLCTEGYKYVVHPFSNFARREQMFFSLVWIGIFIYQPLCFTFYAGQLTVVNGVGTFLTALTLVDTVYRFFLGYVVPQTREIVLDRRRILKHYLKTYFFVDCFPCVVIAVILLINLDEIYLAIMMQITIVRRLRIKSALEGINNILIACGFNRTLRTVTICYIGGLIILHWCSCTLRLVYVLREAFEPDSVDDSWYQLLLLDVQKKTTVNEDSMSWLDKNRAFMDYLHYTSIVLCHTLGAGIGDYDTYDPIEMFILSWILMCGYTIYLISTATLLEYFNILDLGIIKQSESKYEEILNQIHEFMVKKKFPFDLRKRINKYYDYKFDKKYFSENRIMHTLTEHLQMEILLYSCENLITRVQLFKGLSKAAVGCILSRFKQEIYLAGDVVMSSGEETGNLYFILYGTCSVQLLSGREAMHIEDGSLFGENKEFARSAHDFLYKVVAIEPSEIYCLSAEDVRYCCRHYPDVKTKIETMSGVKAKHYSIALAKAMMEDVHVSVSDIVAELRKGKILRQPRYRMDVFDLKYD